MGKVHFSGGHMSEVIVITSEKAGKRQDDYCQCGNRTTFWEREWYWLIPISVWRNLDVVMA